MKRIIAIVFFLVFVFCMIPTAFASNSDFNISGNILISYAGTAKSIAVPDNIKVIGSGAFQHCTQLEVVVLREGVTEIGNGAFNGCSNLELIIIPSTVHTIGQEAFSGTPWLKNQGEVVIVNDIFVAYQGADETFAVPNGIKEILSLAFAWRTSLKKVIIPNGVTTIGAAAFTGCTNLADIIIPSTVSRIEGGAFTSTAWLANQDGAVVVNDILVAYSGFESFVKIPNEVAKMSPAVFYNNSSLKSISIPQGVTSIPTTTFMGCSNLEEVTIPKSVTNVDSLAFEACSNLSLINYEGSRKQWENLLIGDYNTQLQQATINYNYEIEHAPEIIPNIITSAWSTASVSEAVALGIVPSDKLQNDYTQAITREQFCDIAVVVYETLTGNSIQNYLQINTAFSDTESDNIRKMAYLGIVNGCGDIDGDGSPDFAPNAFITREQAASILARLIDVFGVRLAEVTIPFKDSISSWAHANVAKVYGAGIMNGYNNTEFGANGTYTVEQSITTMLRTMKYIQSTKATQLRPENDVTSSAPVNTEVKIYVTRTGSRYHHDATCNGGTYYESDLNEAVRRGLSPCEKCVIH